MSQCTFADHNVRSGLKQKRKLSLFIPTIINEYKCADSSISYVFVTDEHLWEMNKVYLNHDTYTDIITFDLTEKKSNHIVGDIYISIDRVKENAVLHAVSYTDELLRVIIHGALHLSGFGDKTKAQKTQMRLLEDTWLKQFASFV